MTSTEVHLLPRRPLSSGRASSRSRLSCCSCRSWALPCAIRMKNAEACGWSSAGELAASNVSSLLSKVSGVGRSSDDMTKAEHDEPIRTSNKDREGWKRRCYDVQSTTVATDRVQPKLHTCQVSWAPSALSMAELTASGDARACGAEGRAASEAGSRRTDSTSHWEPTRCRSQIRTASSPEDAAHQAQISQEVPGVRAHPACKLQHFR